jgi:hypothetical protein
MGISFWLVAVATNADGYKFLACCGGHECGCMGMPTLIVNCLECNPDNDKCTKKLMEHPEAKYLEFKKLTKG